MKTFALLSSVIWDPLITVNNLYVYKKKWQLLEQAALDEKIEQEAAEQKLQSQTQLLREQQLLLDQRRQRKEQQREQDRNEQLREEERQQREDQLITEERRRILEQHAPLLAGFLPPGIFRDLQEIRTLPADVQQQFQRHVRIQDDPDLWWCRRNLLLSFLLIYFWLLLLVGYIPHIEKIFRHSWCIPRVCILKYGSDTTIHH